MASAFESAKTEDWRSLAEANRLTHVRASERRETLEGKGKSRIKRQEVEDVSQPSVFGKKNLAIVVGLLAVGYVVDGMLSGKRVDGTKGGPFRKMMDALLSPLRRLAGSGIGGKGGWKQKSPAEMARLAAEKRNQSGGTTGGKKKKRKGKKKK